MKKKLSILIPVFNEQATVTQILEKLITLKEVSEVVVVNDGSSDQTAKVITSFLKKISPTQRKKIKVFHKSNGGKGTAIRYGLKHVTGHYTLIQDADLEYDPSDIPLLLEPIKRQRAEVIFGSRFLGPHSNLLFWHRKGNDFLNFLVNILYNTTLSDMETCYKIMPTKLLRELQIKSNRFDIEPEITCKLLRKNVYIFEVPISYVGRDFSQGKKITWRDGLDALRVIFQLRLARHV